MGGGGGKLLLGKVFPSIAANSGELVHLQQPGVPVRAGGRGRFYSCELEFTAADHTLKKNPVPFCSANTGQGDNILKNLLKISHAMKIQL